MTAHVPASAPTFTTAKAAGFESGMLVMFYGANAAAPTGERFATIVRNGAVVRLVDHVNGDSEIARFRASQRMWLATAVVPLTHAEAGMCNGYRQHSNRPWICHNCGQAPEMHSRAVPESVDYCDAAGYADLFRPVTTEPVTCDHVSGTPGCTLPTCVGMGSVGMLTSRPVTVPAEPTPSECGTDTVGRALTLGLRRMLRRSDVTMPLYTDSRPYDVPNMRNVQGWTVVIGSGATALPVTFLAYETRSPLTGTRSVWSILMGEKLLTREDSPMIETAGLNAPATYNRLVTVVAFALDMIGGFGLPTDSCPILDNVTVHAAPVTPDAPATPDDDAPVSVDQADESTPADDDDRNAFGLTRTDYAGRTVHVFDEYATGESVYAATQCADGIRDGDLLHAPSLRLVGFLMKAWPCAVTAAGEGLHRFVASVDPNDSDGMRYAPIVADAVAYARSLGYPIDGDGNGGTDVTPDGPTDVPAVTVDQADASAPADVLAELLASVGNVDQADESTPDAPAVTEPVRVSVTVDRDALVDALTLAVWAAPARPSVPVLAGVMLTADGDTLTLASCDYEVSERTAIPADVASVGRVLVDAKSLRDIVRKLPKVKRPGKGATLPAGAGRVTLVDQGTAFTVAYGSITLTLPTLPVADFPTLPDMPATVATVDAGTFAATVARVTVAAGRDDTLPALTGVALTVDATGRAALLAATDRYRLAVDACAWSPAVTGDDVDAREHIGYTLIPGATLAYVGKLAGKAGGTVAFGQAWSPRPEIVESKGYKWVPRIECIGFTFGSTMITTRVIDAKFPAVRALLPDTYAGTATVDGAALMAVVGRVGMVAGDSPVRLTFTGDLVTVAVTGADNAEASETLACTSTIADGFTAGFNHAYLIDGLKAAGAVTVTLGFTTAAKPAVISADILPEFRYLIMPVRIGNNDTAAAPATAASNTGTEGSTMSAPVTPARKTRKTRTPAVTPAVTPADAPTVDQATPATPADAPAVAPADAPATDPRIEGHAQTALTEMNAGRFAEASAALNTAETGAPVGYLVAGRYTFDQVHAFIAARSNGATGPARSDAAAPATVFESTGRGAPGELRVSADADRLADAADAAYAAGDFVTALAHIDAASVAGGPGYMVGGTRSIDSIADRIETAILAATPAATPRIAEMITALAGIGITVDDRTRTAATVTPVATVPAVAPAAPVTVVAPATVATVADAATAATVSAARDAAVIDAARVAGVATLTAATPGAPVFDMAATVDPSGGYRAVLLPVKRALVAAGLRVFVTRVGRRITLVPQSGALTPEMIAVAFAVMAAHAPFATPVAASV